jgi:hypothetical protein
VLHRDCDASQLKSASVVAMLIEEAPELFKKRRISFKSTATAALSLTRMRHMASTGAVQLASLSSPAASEAARVIRASRDHADLQPEKSLGSQKGPTRDAEVAERFAALLSHSRSLSSAISKRVRKVHPMLDSTAEGSEHRGFFSQPSFSDSRTSSRLPGEGSVDLQEMAKLSLVLGFSPHRGRKDLERRKTVHLMGSPKELKAYAKSKTAPLLTRSATFPAPWIGDEVSRPQAEAQRGAVSQQPDGGTLIDWRPNELLERVPEGSISDEQASEEPARSFGQRQSEVEKGLNATMDQASAELGTMATTSAAVEQNDRLRIHVEAGRAADQANVEQRNSPAVSDSLSSKEYVELQIAAELEALDDLPPEEGSREGSNEQWVKMPPPASRPDRPGVWKSSYVKKYAQMRTLKRRSRGDVQEPVAESTG